jgi:hypothetical protein
MKSFFAGALLKVRIKAGKSIFPGITNKRKGAVFPNNG